MTAQAVFKFDPTTTASQIQVAKHDAYKGKDLAPKHFDNTSAIQPSLPLRAAQPMKALPAPRQAVDYKNFDAGVYGGPNLQLLVEMLTWMRPGGSLFDENFVQKFLIEPFNMHQDGYGNLYYQVGDNPEVMWSSHTDTVHRLQNATASNGRQKIALADGKLVLADPYSKASNCLGADDTAGIWLMLEMIRADVPGLYVFFRDEEIGGLGSSWVAKNHPEYFDGIKAAIALDRKGKTSVITHQGSRTCSDDFARSLASALGQDMGFKPDDTGIFTDTANLTDIIGECSNLSVGYEGAHGPTESLDVAFIIALRKALIEADYSALVFKREPGEVDPEGYSFRGAYGGWNDWNDFDQYLNEKYGTVDKKGRSSRRSNKNWDVLVDGWEGDHDIDTGWENKRSFATASYRPWGDINMIRFVQDNPGLVADFLEYNGFSQVDLENFAEEMV